MRAWGAAHPQPFARVAGSPMRVRSVRVSVVVSIMQQGGAQGGGRGTVGPETVGPETVSETVTTAAAAEGAGPLGVSRRAIAHVRAAMLSAPTEVGGTTAIAM